MKQQRNETFVDRTSLSGNKVPGLFDLRQAENWSRHGFLQCDGLIPDRYRDMINSWVDEIAAYPDAGGNWEHAREETAEGPKLCRTERFLDAHNAMRTWIAEGPIKDMASRLLGEEAVLFKEKINYKLPGGAGFAPHQDAPAYPLGKQHVTCLIQVDDMTLENGCLEFALNHPAGFLERDDKGCVPDHLASQLRWVPGELERNCCLFFSSFAPHRSATNTSRHARRGIFLTYNGISDGNIREAYYSRRKAYLKGEKENSHNEISMISDFQGKIITN